MNNLNIIFAGTPDFAATALQALLDNHAHIVAVYTQPDRPAGRGRKLTASPVKTLAQKQHIPVEQPPNFKQDETLSTLKDYAADLMIVAAYGLLLPPAVLNTPRLGCLNIHASLLPRWRGAAPIQRAIQAGDSETGITIMQMDEGLDTGDILLERPLPILAEDTAGSLHDRLAVLGGSAIVEALQLLTQQALEPKQQDESQACYARKLHKSESEIDWSAPAEDIARQIRAFYPWPGSHTHLDDDLVRIHQAEILDNRITATPGEILAWSKDGLDVQCGQGSLRILQCQLPGSRAMPVKDLHNGHPQRFRAGQCFSMPLARP